MANPEKWSWEVFAAVEQQETRAQARYEAHYDSTLYLKAVVGLKVDRARTLCYDAKAICGHPRYALSRFTWDEKCCEFLAQFLEPHVTDEE